MATIHEEDSQECIEALAEGEIWVASGVSPWSAKKKI